MRKYFLSVLFSCILCQPSLAGSLPDEPHIVVTGEHEIHAVPDILTVSLGIAETGFEVAKARESVEERSRLLIETFKKLGITESDISSAQLQISPHYNWNNQAQIYAGTEVSRIIEVTLRDISRYDELIRAIIDARVARIHSTRLGSSQEQNLREEALRGAIADGMRNGAIMVEHLPEKIGPVYSISPQAINRPFEQAQYEVTGANRQSAFEPGTIVFKESLQLVFYLVREQ
ncbi:MAG: SIMPL domain-containing protein [Desulforhopalus sp.]